MALSIIQSASAVQFSQSPVMFVTSMGDSSFTASRFQYTCNLQYWRGNTANSASANTYQIVKYPNISGSGFFDFSRILNSTLRYNMVENTSSVMNYKAQFGFQYYNGGWVSGSTVTTDVKQVIDGYSLWGEAINNNVGNTGLYPFLTDGPLTQSVYSTDRGTLSIDTNATTASVSYAFVYTSTTVNVSIGLTGSSAARIKRIPAAPAQAGFTGSLTNLKYYTITSNGRSIRFDVGCESKYTPVRIGYKNRFGQVDFFTFNKASKDTFSTTQKTYSPNAGNWNNTTFGADQYVNQSQKYIIDTKEYMDVNTDYISEAYNNAFKQMMVSDEIYWYKNDGTITPVSIETNNVQMRKGVNDKLIQYSFRFAIGQNFKFIV